MGRTVPSFRMALNGEIESWKFFKNLLDRDDKPRFEEMLNSARLYGVAGSAGLRLFVFESMAMSIIFEHYRKLTEVMDELDDLKRRRNYTSSAEQKDEKGPDIPGSVEQAGLQT